MDDDVIIIRHHQNDETAIPTPVSGAVSAFAAILAAVNTSGLSVGQSALLSQLVSYCS